MQFKSIGELIKAFKTSDGNKVTSLLKNSGSLESAAKMLNAINIDTDKFTLLKGAFKDAKDDAINAALGISKVGDESTKSISKVKNLGNAFVGAGKSAKNLFVGTITAHPIITAITAIIGSIALVSAAVTDAQEKVENAVTSAEKYQQTKSEVQSINSELETLGSQIDAINAKENLSLTDAQELANLQAQSAELERQLEIKKSLAEIEQQQAARDAKNAFSAKSSRNAIDTNGEGFWTNIADGIESFAAWFNDKTGATEAGLAQTGGLVGFIRGESNAGTPDQILSDRIKSAKEAQKKLKELQDKQTAENYDSIQSQINKQQKVVDNYATNLQELYSEMESYTKSFYDDSTGEVLNGFEEEAKRWETVQNEYLAYFGKSASSKEGAINTIFAKKQFSGLEESFTKAAQTGESAIKSLINETPGISDALDKAGVSVDEFVQHFMALGNPDALKLDEVKKQLKEAFSGDLGDNATYGDYKNYDERARQFNKFLKDKTDEEIEIFYRYVNDGDIDLSELTLEDIEELFIKVNADTTPAQKSLEELTQSANDVVSSITSINSILSSQSTGQSISSDIFSDETLKDYSSALEYVNGNYQLNREEVKKITEAKVKEQLATNDLAKAQQQQEYVKNAQEISELTQKLQNNTLAADESAESIQSQIDALTSANAAIVDQCKQYDLLNASLRESIGVYQEWKDAQNAAESGDMFDDTKNAWKQIRDVADKDSDEYNKVGNPKYQASVDLLVPDSINHSDQKAVQKYLDSIRKYMTFDDNGNVNGVNMDKFFNNAVKKGLMIDDGENYQLAGEMTMKDFAEGMNMALPLVQAVFGEILEYKPEDEQWFSWADEAVESLGDLSVAASDALSDLTSSTMSADLQNQLDELSEGGNVDLKVRPVIDAEELTKAGWDDAGDGIATVFTSTYSNEDGTVAMNFTPIMTDGKGNATGVMSPEELQSYAEDVISGVREDDLNLKIGATFEGEDAIDQASKVAEQIHEIQGTTEYTKARLSSAFSNLGVNLDLSGIEDDKKKVESLTNTIEQMKNVKATPGVDTSQIQDANTVIQYCVQQIQQLNAPVIMSVDTSMVQGQVGQALTTLQNFKQAANDLQVLTEIGADTTDAQAKVDGLVSEVQSINPKIIAELGIDTSSADTISQSIQGIQPETLVKLGVDDAAIIGYTAEDKNGKVVYTVDHSQVDTYNPPNLNRSVTYTITTLGALPSGSIASPVPGSSSKSKNNKKSGGHSLNGTAHAGGTWGAKTGGTTLVGELGREIVVDPNTGKWHTVGDNGAEFTNIPKGAIVFNHLQTEELLENGFVTSRASALVSGNALMSGNAMVRGGIPKSVTTKKNKKQKTTEKRSSSKSTSSDKSTTNNTKATDKNTTATNKNTEATENLQDWIEYSTNLQSKENDRLYNAIESFEMHANQNKAIDAYITDSQAYMNTLRNAQNAYMSKANALGLDANYIHKIWAGDDISFEDIQDENLRDKISKYQDYYSKAKELGDQMTELNQKIRETKISKLENIQDDYDNLVSYAEGIIDYNEAVNDLFESRNLVGNQDALMNNINQQMAIRQALVNEEKELTDQLNALVASGDIAEYTDTWLKWKTEINGVTSAIVKADSALEELKQSIMEIRYKSFEDSLNNLDFNSEMFSSIRDLMSQEGIYDDNVKLTDSGKTQLALMEQELISAKQKVANYNTAIEALAKDLAYGNITQAQFNEKLQEYQKDQMGAVKATKDARDAILDLVKDGITKESEAVQELIQKRKDDLSLQKEYYDFQKKMNDKSKEMNKIRAQIAAMEGDNSLETVAKRKKLMSQLQELEEEYNEELNDRKYDLVQDAYDKTNELTKENEEKALKELETNLNVQNEAIANALEVTKATYATVYEQLNMLAQQYNFTLTDSLTSPWLNAQSAIDSYQQAIGKVQSNVSIDTSQIQGTTPSQNQTVPTKNEASTQNLDKSANGTWLKQGNQWWYQHAGGGWTNNGWEQIDGKWYKFDQNGWMQSGWQPWGADSTGQTAWYYMGDPNDGSMKTSTWVQGKGGKQYFVDHSGVMARNGYVKSVNSGLYYWVNGEGVWEPQWSTYNPNLSKYKLYYNSGKKRVPYDALAYIDDTPDHKLDLGSEAIITDKGALVQMDAGDTVFNKAQKEFLYEFSKGQIPAGARSMLPSVNTNFASMKPVNKGDININYGSLLTVNGDIDKEVFPGMQKTCESTFDYFVKNMRKYKNRLN